MCILCENEKSLYIDNRVCNYCNSTERQRAFYKNIIGQLLNKKILLISPFKGEIYYLDKYKIKYDVSNYFSPLDKNNWNIHCKNECDNVTYVNSLTDLKKIKDEEYDCVIVFHVIGKIKNDMDCFNSIKRVLKNNGILYHNDPFTTNNKLEYTKTGYRKYPIDKLKNVLSKIFIVDILELKDPITLKNIIFLKYVKNIDNKQILLKKNFEDY